MDLTERDRGTRAALRRIARWANALAAGIGAAGLIGWAADLELLRTFGAAFPSIPLATSLCLLIAAGAVAAGQTGDPRAERWVRVAAAVIALIAGLTLVGYALGTPAGMDLGFTGLARSARDFPQPMSVSTALAFIAIAVAIVVLQARSAAAAALNRAIAIGLLASVFVALVGLTFNVLLLYAATPLLGMAVPAAVAFLLLGASLLAGRPDRWLVHVLTSDRPGAVMTRWLLPAAVGAPLLIGWARMLGERYGLFNAPMGAGLLTLVMTGVLGALTLWVARALDQMDLRRKRAEEEARTQREWLQVILAGIDDSVIATDRSGEVRFLNAAAQRLTGRSPAEAVGRPIAELFDIVDEGSGASMASPLERALRDREVAVAGGEPALQMRSGALHPVEIQAAPILDSRDDLVGAVLVLRDAGARREAERAMREAYAELDHRVIERTAALERAMAIVRERTRLLSTITASTPDLIWAKDLESRILMVNRAWLRAMGKDEQEVLGRSALEFVADPDQARRTIENDRRVVESGKSIVAEEPFSGSGGPRVYLTTNSPLRDERGRTVGLIGVATDITDRKRAERELEELVATEQRLRAEAERANRAKDEFLAIVSHELRSPLNALRGWGHFLASTRPLDPALVERATQAIKRSVEHQARLIDDLLDTSRILSGKLTLERHPFNLVDVVHGALEIARPGASAKHIELGAAFDYPVVTVDGDPGRLQQVVTNLLSNAVKFTPENGRIETSVRLVGERIQLAVRDNGVGIAREFLPHVFDRFTQADTSTTRRAGGLGIGLALVRHLVEAHGGQVRAESDGPGAGSTFTVELPAVATATGHIPASPAESQPPAGRLRDLTIYVVDDDADAREVVGFALRDAGASVETFETGPELAARLGRTLATGRPDVLLLDLAMPGEDGFAVLEQIRSLEAERGIGPDRSIPAIAVTAFAEVGRERLAAAGFCELVGKPIDAERLVSTIRAVLDAPVPGQPPPPPAVIRPAL